MTRLATTIDRLAALVFGLALIAVGLGVLVWHTHWIAGIPDRITAPGLIAASETRWWPWAVAGVGIVLVLLALRWLLAHTPKARVKDLRLATNDHGTVSGNLDEVAAAAARALHEHPEVKAAKGKAVVDRGSTTVDLDVTAQSAKTVAALIGAIDSVNRQLVGVLGNATTSSRTRIHVEKHPRRARVE